MKKVFKFISKYGISIVACAVMAFLCLVSYQALGSPGEATLTSIGQTMNIADDLTVGGNVGIGTADPQAKLDVDGDIEVGGSIVSPNFPIAAGYADDNYSQGSTINYGDQYVNNGDYYNPSSGVFTAPVEGIYEWCATMRETSGTTVYGAIFINGSQQGDRKWWARDGLRRLGHDCQQFYAYPGDEIEHRVVDNGTNNCGQAYCGFRVMLLAQTAI